MNSVSLFQNTVYWDHAARTPNKDEALKSSLSSLLDLTEVWNKSNELLGSILSEEEKESVVLIRQQAESSFFMSREAVQSLADRNYGEALVFSKSILAFFPRCTHAMEIQIMAEKGEQLSSEFPLFNDILVKQKFHQVNCDTKLDFVTFRWSHVFQNKDSNIPHEKLTILESLFKQIAACFRHLERREYETAIEKLNVVRQSLPNEKHVFEIFEMAQAVVKWKQKSPSLNL